MKLRAFGLHGHPALLLCLWAAVAWVFLVFVVPMSPVSASQPEEIEGDWRALHRQAVRAARNDELQRARRLEKAALDRFLFATGPDKRTRESLRVLVLNVARLEAAVRSGASAIQVLRERVARLDPRDRQEARFAVTILETMLDPPFQHSPATQHQLCRRLEEVAVSGFGPHDPETVRVLLSLAEIVARPVSAWQGRPRGTREAMAYLAKAKAAASFLPVDHPLHRRVALGELRLLHALGREKELLSSFRKVMANARLTASMTDEQKTELLKLGLHALYAFGHEDEARSYLDQLNRLRPSNSPPEALYDPALPPHAAEGTAKAEILLDIDETGRVSHIRIRFLKGKRSKSWLKKARRLIATWRYAPRLENGKPVPTRDYRESYVVTIVRAL
ncbi:MAG: hypothetical protein D6740_10540 [Alphaproteobacteria bacterium]|nr:MAG: hypothetical protein D6740_10540 [Alphaproteobacteria bacterium]